MSEQEMELKPEVDETTVPPAPEEEANDDSSEQDGEPVEKTEDEPEVDYSAELTRLKTERDNYKEGMLSAKKKLKAREDDEEIPVEAITSDSVREALDAFKNEFLGDVIDESLDEISESEAEKNLIKFHYENTLIKSGHSKKSIAADLRKAKLLANESKIMRENSELKETLKSKNTLNKSGLGASSKTATHSWAGYTAQEREIMERNGLTPKDIKKS